MKKKLFRDYFHQGFFARGYPLATIQTIDFHFPPHHCPHELQGTRG